MFLKVIFSGLKKVQKFPRTLRTRPMVDMNGTYTLGLLKFLTIYQTQPIALVGGIFLVAKNGLEEFPSYSKIIITIKE